ncbi:hypothetical protein [Stutzerimonas stutzeri]|uniref:hypothetical protein n=1 Tax=Stutzerimonas stutzeri TaxID=316 RepID=UPI0011AEDDC9|nr:hypothetical protein [Stutzerimonas stutzeri]MCQ4262829.1 hypothetical protein [Stutzerimonas stutzeri]
MSGSLRDLYNNFRYEYSVIVHAGFERQASYLAGGKAQQFIYFNPQKVRRCLNKVSVRSPQFCIDRGWADSDVVDIALARSAIVETVRLMFLEGKNYKDTPQYEVMLKAVLSGPATAKQLGDYWCRTIKDIDVYFQSLEQAYRRISTEGYKTQAQLTGEGSALGMKKDDEIKLYVDRSGELILGGGGTHRLCIAKSLELSSIPGIVRGVDLRWARSVYKANGIRRLDDSLSASLQSDSWAQCERLARVQGE